MSNIKPKVEPFIPDPQEAILNEDLERLAEIIERGAPGQGRLIVVSILKEFAGTNVYFVQPDTPFKLSRDKWIVEQFDRGCKVSDIARVAKMCEAQVWNILGKAPGEDKQMRLF